MSFTGRDARISMIIPLLKGRTLAFHGEKGGDEIIKECIDQKVSGQSAAYIKFTILLCKGYESRQEGVL